MYVSVCHVCVQDGCHAEGADRPGERYSRSAAYMYVCLYQCMCVYRTDATPKELTSLSNATHGVLHAFM